MDWSEWLPWKCWVCQGELDEGQQEVNVPSQGFPAPSPNLQIVQAKIRASSTKQPPQAGEGVGVFPGASRPCPRPGGARGSGRVGDRGGAEGAVDGSSRQARAAGDAGAGDANDVAAPSADGAPPVGSQPLPAEQERARLRELMKAFVNAGMRGVSCEILSEVTGELRPGSYLIDEKLRSMTFEVAAAQAQEGGSEPGTGARHVVPFASVSEVFRLDDGAESRFPEVAMHELDDAQRSRLLLIVYATELGETREVFILEQSPSDQQRFLTCVRILRRYMDEQTGKGKVNLVS